MPWRRELAGQSRLLLVLVVWALVTGVVVTSQGDWASLNLLILPLVAASLMLNPKLLYWFVIGTLALAVIAVSARTHPNAVTATSTASIFLIGLMVLVAAFRRARLGVGGVTGESMFVDLRDRLLAQGTLPQLPDDWGAESAVTSAGGTLFAGDFVVAIRVGARFELVLVDVSGKGEAAGTRALLLSGAFGGLLGALPPSQFLPAANEFLLRQEWDEGFATAVHISVALETGAFEVRSAGHPPAVFRINDEWQVAEAEGPLLGIIDDPDFEVFRGVLDSGDIVMLYTDGVVEDVERDIDIGIDRLITASQSQLSKGFEGSARRLVKRLGAAGDDRTLLIVQRFGPVIDAQNRLKT